MEHFALYKSIKITAYLFIFVLFSLPGTAQKIGYGLMVGGALTKPVPDADYSIVGLESDTHEGLYDWTFAVLLRVKLKPRLALEGQLGVNTYSYRYSFIYDDFSHNKKDEGSNTYRFAEASLFGHYTLIDNRIKLNMLLGLGLNRILQSEFSIATELSNGAVIQSRFDLLDREKRMNPSWMVGVQAEWPLKGSTSLFIRPFYKRFRRGQASLPPHIITVFGLGTGIVF